MYPEPGSNRHGHCWPQDFKSGVSTDSTIRAQSFSERRTQKYENICDLPKHPQHNAAAGRNSSFSLFRTDIGDYRRIVVGGEPTDLRVTAEPRELPLGITPRIALDQLHSLVVPDAPVEIIEKFAVTDRLQRI